MAKSCNQKAKILYLERMLWETGEDRLLTMQEILCRLEEYGIHGERKSIYDDMEVLRSFGMDIRYKRGGGYYMAAGAETVPSRLREQNEEITAPEAMTQAPAEIQTVPQLRPETDGLYGKKLRLLAEEEVKDEILRSIGTLAKEKEDGSFVINLRVTEDEKLFGWLASFGKKVHIMKPGKTALAYRNYLKSIAREYKGIDK